MLKNHIFIIFSYFFIIIFWKLFIIITNADIINTFPFTRARLSIVVICAWSMNLLVEFSTYIPFFLPLCMFLIGLFGGSFAVDRGSRGFLYSCTFYGFLLKILVLLISILSVALTLMYHLSAGYRKEKIFGQTFMTYSYTVRKCEQSLRVLSA